MKFRKVYVERKQWAVIYVATNDGASDPHPLAVERTQQAKDSDIWTTEGFTISHTEECPSAEASWCELVQ